MIAQDIMTANPVSLSVSDTVRDALDLMHDRDFRHVPVVEGGELAGMVSDRDLRSYTLPLLEAVSNPETAFQRLDTPLSEVMQGGVVSVDLETPLSELIDLMVEHRVGAIPVVDVGGTLLRGIISYIDVLKAVQE